MADRDGHAVVPAASGNDPELDSIERWPDVGRMAAGRRTPRGATLAPLEDSSAPSNEQEEGHSTSGSGPNYTSYTTAASRLLLQRYDPNELIYIDHMIMFIK